MDAALLHRLDRILALTSSEHEGEALLALRKAAALLADEGLGWRDLTQLALKRRSFLPFLQPASADPAPLPPLSSAEQAHSAALAAAKQRIATLETQLAQSRREAQRWHQLARDSVDTLVEMGGTAPSARLSDHATHGMAPPLKRA